MLLGNVDIRGGLLSPGVGVDSFKAGRGASAPGDGSISIGLFAGNDGDDGTISLGQAYVELGSIYGIAVGEFAGIGSDCPNSQAFGDNAFVNNNAPDSMAMGSFAYIGDSSPQSMALGSNAVVPDSSPDCSIAGFDCSFTNSGVAGGVLMGSGNQLPNGCIGIGFGIVPAVTNQAADSTIIGLSPSIQSGASGDIQNIGHRNILRHSSIAIGNDQDCGSYSIGIGDGVDTSGGSAIGIGWSVIVSHNTAIVIGLGAESEESGACHIGSVSGGANMNLKVAGSIRSTIDGRGNAITLQDHVESSGSVTPPALSGASVTFAGLIPPGVVVLGITAFVKTTITGATGWDLGDGSTQNRWASNKALAAGTTSDVTDSLDTSAPVFATAQDVVVTALGSDFTGGAIRVTVHYMKPIPGPN